MQLQQTFFTAFALVVGPVSFFTTAVLLHFNEEKLGRLGKALALFLVVWNAVGLLLETVGNPFLYGGNGFFSAFAMSWMSFSLAQVRWPRAHRCMSNACKQQD